MYAANTVGLPIQDCGPLLSTNPGGDPQCILEGPAPTAQCLAANP
jgi:hypothetical protein